jgi:hypothetical protein
MVAEMLRLYEISLEEALREQQEVQVFSVALGGECFHASDSPIDVTKNLRCLASADPHHAGF